MLENISCNRLIFLSWVSIKKWFPFFTVTSFLYLLLKKLKRMQKLFPVPSKATKLAKENIELNLCSCIRYFRALKAPSSHISPIPLTDAFHTLHPTPSSGRHTQLQFFTAELIKAHLNIQLHRVKWTNIVISNSKRNLRNAAEAIQFSSY